MDLQNIFLQAHRGFAYLELVLFTVFLISMLMVKFGNRPVPSWFRRVTLFAMIGFHIQFLLGIIMLFGTSPFTDMIKASGMGAVMKNAALRFTYIEHPFSMLVSAILMTIINRKVKSSEYLPNSVVILTVIILALVGYAIPYARLFS